MDAGTWDRIAEDYLEHIVSPFDTGTANPLLDELAALPRERREAVTDIGCGVGSLLPFLADNFDHVTALDFSREMLRQARARVDATNVSFRRADMRDLSRFHERFDVAVAVNSVLAPSPRRVNRILSEIRRTLKPGGLFFGIFPAMDSVLYHAMLVLERETEEHPTDPTALRHTRDICERSKYDFMTGVFDDNGDRQKHYYRFELRHRLHKANFTHLRFRKVRYPWDESVSGYELFPGEPRLWDWLVCATA